MIHEVKKSQVRVLYGGKKAGNLDTRFSSAKEIKARRDNLLQQLNVPFVMQMQARGGDTFLDLKDVSYSKGWNEIEGDGLITDRKDVALLLLPADCIPLVIYSESSSSRALVHVGRKGAELGVHKKVINYLLETSDTNSSDIRFYIGPSIRADSYYFPQIEHVQKEDPSWRPFIRYKNNNYHIDLLNFVIDDLLSLGFTSNQFEISPIDTGSNKEYYSHARSSRTGELQGRNTFAVTCA